MPVEALNMFETDVGSMFGVTNQAMSDYKIQTDLSKVQQGISDIDFKTSMIMTPSLLFSLNSEELCKFARSGEGSRFLQRLVSPSNTKLCHKMLELLLALATPIGTTPSSSS